MRQFFLFSFFLLFAGCLSAQQMVMKIYKNNNEVVAIPLSSIDSVTYEMVDLPTITTSSVTSITSSGAVSGGDISFDGGYAVSARGVCWSTSSNPTTADHKTNDGTGSGTFNSNMTGLLPNTTYYVRAYATNIAGTTYGSEISFTTDVVALPINVLVTDFDGNGSWSSYVQLGSNSSATSAQVNSTNYPVPGANSGDNYWKCTGTTNGYYLEGVEINGAAFNLDLNDSIVFYGHNFNSSRTRVFVQLVDKKNLGNGYGEVFSYEILLPASNSWERYAVCLNQLSTWNFPTNNHPDANGQYYPSLAEVDRMWLLINSIDFTESIEVNFDDVEIIRVP